MLKMFQSHKVVEAGKIIDVQSPADPTSTGVLKLEGHFGIELPSAYFEKHAPTVGGYYVKYPDGYESFSPAEPFESGYALFDPNEATKDELRAELNGAKDTIATRDMRIAELEARDAEQAHKIAELEIVIEDGGGLKRNPPGDHQNDSITTSGERSLGKFLAQHDGRPLTLVSHKGTHGGIRVSTISQDDYIDGVVSGNTFDPV